MRSGNQLINNDIISPGFSGGWALMATLLLSSSPTRPSSSGAKLAKRSPDSLTPSMLRPLMVTSLTSPWRTNSMKDE